MRTANRSALLAGLLLGPMLGLLAGCAVGPNFVKPKPAVPARWSRTALQASGRRASVVDPQAQAVTQWWRSFHDPELTSLVRRSAAANLDLREAVLRVDESLEERAVTAGGLWPSLSGNASFTRERLSPNTPNGAIFGSSVRFPGLPPGVSLTNPFNQFQLGLAASWEIDLFGRLRRSVEAASAQVRASVEDAHGVMISLVSDVAADYIELRGAQLRKSILEKSLATDRGVLELTRQRWNAGLTSDLDVENAASEVNSTEAQLPLVEQQITDVINQLSELLGLPPEALRAELATSKPVPPVPPAVPIGLPADLARRRPDIRRAEANLHAATARIGVATASLFPRLTLTAAGGLQSQQLSELIEAASRFATLGPAIELPIFDAGAHAQVRLEDVRAKQAAVAYAKTVLDALHEVEDALAAYGADQDRRVSLTKAAAASASALELAQQRYQGGLTSFIEVLDAERTLEQNRLAHAQATTAVSADLVRLYKALGGGWQGAEAPRVANSGEAEHP
ncbi:MAG: efflux transporter outer membrane subunit [Steroidobacteraceae bacterium]